MSHFDTALEATGYTTADAIWHRATDALLAHDYDKFDALMHEFRATTKHWKSPAERTGAANNCAGDTHGD